MIQLDVLSGKRAGTACVARRFPLVIGREKTADLRLEDEGVWDRHVEFDMRMAEGFVLKVRQGALACINAQPTREARLRNGDLIELGSVKIRFGLSPTNRLTLGLRETMVWTGLALLCAAQVALIYTVLP